MAAVTIASVDCRDVPGIHFELESPTPGVAPHGWAVAFSGWAFASSSNHALTALRIGSEGVEVGRINPGLPRPDVSERFPDAADATGFYLAISALEWDTDFSLDVTAERADGEPVVLATISGTRDPLAPATDARFHPLILNCLGRVGSTWLSFLLDRHPEILAYRAFEFETRTLVYWLEMLKAMGRPRSYFQTFAADLNNPRWWLGDADPAPVRSLPDDGILQWMGGAGVQGLAGFCASQADGFYATVAAVQQKPRARLFVEKTGHPFHCRAMRELYPDAREVFLVRDFRDMFTSMRQHFAEHPRDARPDDELLESVTRGLEAYVRQWEKRRMDARLVRYEDLVRDPASTLTDLLGWLKVDASTPVVETMLAEARASRPDLQAEHQTARSPEDSIGRWKRDLPAELAEACDTALGQMAEMFGY